jgi:hypothetical protein
MRTLAAANAALERFAGEGWGSVLGPAGRGNEAERFGGSAVVERDTGPGSSARVIAALT